MRIDKAGIYIHIPFCVKKCNYCDFLSFVCDEDGVKRYIKRLKHEIEEKAYRYKDKEFSTIFIGGGTPSSISAHLIKDVLNVVYECYNIEEDSEITIESNPGTLDKEKLSVYRLAGINRLSIGLQSPNDKEIKILGRIHTFKDFERSYYMAREIGYDNINIDLMSALPNQTVEDYKKNLNTVIDFAPEHISAYSLIIEQDTPFYDIYHEDDYLRSMGSKSRYLPSEEEERNMYHMTEQILTNAGYNRYEISNYAKEGFECRHNLGCWELREYIGFGLGAASYEGFKRYNNIKKLDDYINAKNTIDEKSIECIDEEEQMTEYMILSLRLTKGASFDEFKIRFNKDLRQVYKQVNDKLFKEGLIIMDDNHIALSKRGFDLANYCMMQY